MTKNGKTCITICLGSSCFTRGNDEHLPLVQAWLANHDLTDRVALKGSRCEGKCMHGPNLKIDDTLVHDVKAADLESILECSL